VFYDIIYIVFWLTEVALEMCSVHELPLATRVAPQVFLQHLLYVEC